MQDNSKFESPGLETCAFTVRTDLPPSTTAKALSMPELLDLIIQAVISCQKDAVLVQGAICQLRLVSHAFHVAADPYFAVDMADSPFGEDRDDTFRRRYEEKIRICGPYIRRMDLTSGLNNNVEFMELIGNCCPNVKEIAFSFLENTQRGIGLLDYRTLLKKWSSTNTNSSNGNNCNGYRNYRNNIKKITIRRNMDLEEGTVDNFDEGFDGIREYLRGIDTFTIQTDSLFNRHTSEIVPHKPLYWETLIGFFRSFPNLASFVTRDSCIQWSLIPPAGILSSEGYEEMSFPNLTSLSFHTGDLDLSIISRLNRMFPNLDCLIFYRLVSVYGGENGPGGQGEGDGTSSLLIPIATNSVKLTIKRMRIGVAQVSSVHELLGIAPALKELTCGNLQAQRNLNRFREDLLAALKPFGDRRWDKLSLYTLGSYQPLNWEKILNDSSKSNDQ